ncbi:DSBA oxidoreductase [Gemmatirosa kalamazoonensis]|uniref:DSBA oxidoreductase n=1 Tax=Gemmatirosa kalamazoonensis TaxID=861299 RepID=W0RKP8_9BACT|nr:DsbA family oxidoreductase [Gemmatirosa kalamazoonensis]AHG91659.1 DSBA oxidoreductase [Gemmatirosa kalamazoonensis]
MRVEIWSDIACPWCYLGKRRFERALDEFAHRDAIDVVWRSFELNPNAPARQEGTSAEALARKYRVPLAQAQSMNARMAGEAAKEGLVMRFDRVRPANTFDAHRLAHLAATVGRRAQMVERLFAAHFTEGAELGDRDVLARLAADVGISEAEARTALDGDAFADAVRADEARARDFGVDGVPFFALDERYGVPGAQPTEVLLQALRQAWEETDSAMREA